MSSKREDFRFSGPLHLIGTVDWKNVRHRAAVAACLVHGVSVVERDRQKQREGSQAFASPWWKSLNFKMVSQLQDDVDSSIFGAIYKFEPPASYSNLSIDGCPYYVIAFRGTLLKRKSFKRDLELDFHILRNTLDTTSRFEIAMRAVRDMVASVGSSNVWLAGHSLGSAIALLVGKTMAKEEYLLASFLFNSPYPSVPIEKIVPEKVHHVFRGAVNVVRAGVALAEKKMSGDSSLAQSAWVPNVFVNTADHISSGYVGYFDHKKKMEEIGVGGIERLATQLSLRGSSEPMHRIPSANLVVNSTRSRDAHGIKRLMHAHGIKRLMHAHGIKQWWSKDLLH
ncbi:hypothetical protein Ddye_002878 [Dipteronia dyeriana]|uniref:Fungal lipase-type domain-containing protein n=1 Tax=Dipteronia dyeriana TaxID=168575 RepID=A0AAD9XR85_9ROSI|nr:hypothetical protein Ddye_002878 [Dipteronia dyeriana]